MSKVQKFIFIFSSFLVFVIFSQISYAQSIKVSGTVFDENKESLPGVSKNFG
jgi:hypothetical protein